MLGTAFPASRLLLVEQPFPWGPEGLRTSHFDRDTALAVEARGRDEGVRVQAIRRLGRTHSAVSARRWAAVDTRHGGGVVRWGSFAADADLLDLPLDGSTGEIDPEPLYLVCTHGRHDPCCGQRGHAVAEALAALAPDRVWQTSHLGGCRFAPTVLVLPSGVMYGRVPVSTVSRLVAAVDSDEVIDELFRGRIGIPPAAQAAVGHAHRYLGLRHSREVAVVSSRAATDGGMVVVRLTTPDGMVDVSVRRDRIDATGLTCGAPGPSWFVAHHPLAPEPAWAASAPGS